MATCRRWLQFSLRTFLIVLTVGCLWLGSKVERARKQREAVEAIEAVGGVVQYDWQGDIASWKCIAEFRLAPVATEPPTPKWLRVLVGDHWFQNVKSVVFRTFRSAYEPKGPGVAINVGNTIRTSKIEEVIPHLRNLDTLQMIWLQLALRLPQAIEQQRIAWRVLA